MVLPSEGTSVAIMEAMSVGIPVIATAVGGNIELLEGENGILLPENSTATELAKAFEHFCENPKMVKVLRENSRKHWEKNYAAGKNYLLLAEHLAGLLAEG